jgi:hypothetical protein
MPYPFPHDGREDAVANIDAARRPRGEALRERQRLGVALFLVAALASFILSIGLWFTDNREEGVFVGLWVPSILSAGAFWVAAVRER